MIDQQTADYISRINKALDFIDQNLEKDISLDDLATTANFSKYHFSRIFLAFINETPFQFVLRVRLEKAATLLLSNPGVSITEIAWQCGFSDIVIFSRNFKRRFGYSATQYRKIRHNNRNKSQTDSKNEQAFRPFSQYLCTDLITKKMEKVMKENKSVEVKIIPEMTLAYIRHIGPYQGNENLFENLWNRLFAWAGPRGLLGQKDLKSLIIYHDDPNVTNEEKLRMSLCISVPENTEVGGEIGKMTLESANYVIARFELDASQFGEAWNWVYAQWLPQSGYQPDDKPCFEMYPEEPKNGLFTVEICVPVKPM
ncbi:MAG TPA: AraC family transcriptional regulator [Saprospiraceae bacterium]|nr:AraC family transcriptional regulator [Saprospiraceae bacterium]